MNIFNVYFTFSGEVLESVMIFKSYYETFNHGKINIVYYTKKNIDRYINCTL